MGLAIRNIWTYRFFLRLDGVRLVRPSASSSFPVFSLVMQANWVFDERADSIQDKAGKNEDAENAIFPLDRWDTAELYNCFIKCKTLEVVIALYEQVVIVAKTPKWIGLRFVYKNQEYAMLRYLLDGLRDPLRWRESHIRPFEGQTCRLAPFGYREDFHHVGE